MAQVETEINKMSASVKASDSISAESTTALSSKLTAEKQALRNLEDHIKVPLNPKPCNTTT